MPILLGLSPQRIGRRIPCRKFNKYFFERIKKFSLDFAMFFYEELYLEELINNHYNYILPLLAFLGFVFSMTITRLTSLILCLNSPIVCNRLTFSYLFYFFVLFPRPTEKLVRRWTKSTQFCFIKEIVQWWPMRK